MSSSLVLTNSNNRALRSSVRTTSKIYQESSLEPENSDSRDNRNSSAQLSSVEEEDFSPKSSPKRGKREIDLNFHKEEKIKSRNQPSNQKRVVNPNSTKFQSKSSSQVLEREGGGGESFSSEEDLEVPEDPEDFEWSPHKFKKSSEPNKILSKKSSHIKQVMTGSSHSSGEDDDDRRDSVSEEGRVQLEEQRDKNSIKGGELIYISFLSTRVDLKSLFHFQKFSSFNSIRPLTIVCQQNLIYIFNFYLFSIFNQKCQPPKRFQTLSIPFLTLTGFRSSKRSSKSLSSPLQTVTHRHFLLSAFTLLKSNYSHLSYLLSLLPNHRYSTPT
jgi:hypothetical protein